MVDARTLIGLGLVGVATGAISLDGSAAGNQQEPEDIVPPAVGGGGVPAGIPAFAAQQRGQPQGGPAIGALEIEAPTINERTVSTGTATGPGAGSSSAGKEKPAEKSKESTERSGSTADDTDVPESVKGTGLEPAFETEQETAQRVFTPDTDSGGSSKQTDSSKKSDDDPLMGGASTPYGGSTSFGGLF